MKALCNARKCAGRGGARRPALCREVLVVVSPHTDFAHGVLEAWGTGGFDWTGATFGIWPTKQTAGCSIWLLHGPFIWLSFSRFTDAKASPASTMIIALTLVKFVFARGFIEPTLIPRAKVVHDIGSRRHKGFAAGWSLVPSTSITFIPASSSLAGCYASVENSSGCGRNPTSHTCEVWEPSAIKGVLEVRVRAVIQGSIEHCDFAHQCRHLRIGVHLVPISAPSVQAALLTVELAGARATVHRITKVPPADAGVRHEHFWHSCRRC